MNKFLVKVDISACRKIIERLRFTLQTNIESLIKKFKLNFLLSICNLDNVYSWTWIYSVDCNKIKQLKKVCIEATIFLSTVCLFKHFR